MLSARTAVFRIVLVTIGTILCNCACDDRHREVPAQEWGELRAELAGRGDVAFEVEPTGKCKLGHGVVYWHEHEAEGTFGSKYGPVKYRFEAKSGKYIVVYGITSQDGAVTPVAVYEPILVPEKSEEGVVTNAVVPTNMPGR
jgi:hypothetical protein